MAIIALDVENLDMEYIFAETKVISSKLPQILVIQVETAEIVEQMCLQANNKQKLQEQFDVSVKFIVSYIVTVILETKAQADDHQNGFHQ